MTKAQKILVGVGIIGVIVGGFFLTKFLTRNVKKYRFYTITVSTDETPALSSADVE